MADDNSHTENIGLLGLSAWPFNVVPVRDARLTWADRKGLLNQISRLLRRLSSHQASTLHLVWADFGAGKTHTLLYLGQLAVEQGNQILPVYTVLPKGPRSFVDIYRAIIRGIGFDRMLLAYEAVRRSGQESPLAHTPGLATAFEALRLGGDALRETSERWLSADPSLTRKELYDASLPGRIRSTDDALVILTAITKLLLTQNRRVLVMVDEFQRTGMLRRALLDEMNAGLHTYFNDNPQGLTMILSFSFGSASNIRYHLNEELLSRADPRVFAIPVLDIPSARVFLRDLVAGAKLPTTTNVFGDDIYSVIAEYVNQYGVLSPRDLIQAAASVFSESLLDLEDGVIEVIEPDYAKGILESQGPIGLYDSE